MVSLVINSLRLWLGANHIAECSGNLPALADLDEPDAGKADAQAVGRRSGIGAEYKAGLAQTKDGAGGGQAEERTCARGRGMLLFKIRESRTRMRGRDDSFRMGPLKRDLNSLKTEPKRENHPRG